MDIIWHGQGCFTIKGSTATVVTDPYTGAEKLKANVVTVSNPELFKADVVPEDPRVLDWTGEYEAGGVLLTAIPARGDGGKRINLFHIEIDGLKVAHLGGLSEKLTDEEVEILGDVDVVMVPVGGEGTLDAKTAHEVIEQIDPRIVVPMRYTDSAAFTKEIGSHGEPQEKLTLKSRADLPEETTTFVVLQEV